MTKNEIKRRKDNIALHGICCNKQVRSCNIFRATIPSKRTEVNYPRVDKDLFMFAASFKRSPSAPELFCLNFQANYLGIQNKLIEKKK